MQIERFIKGEADEDDIKYIESLLSDGENDQELKEIIRTDWESGIYVNDICDFDHSSTLEKIHRRILKRQFSQKKKPVSRILSFYRSAAAILLLPLIIAGSLLYSHVNKDYNRSLGQTKCSILAPKGSRISFSLPDGTTGMLNGGSLLEYLLPFSKREVRLNGEAWLSVKHDAKHPFEIKAGNSKIAVLGTKLNISAYQDERYVEVVLQEGKVDFYKDGGTEKTSIKPSERIVFENGLINRSIVDTTKYTSWVRGKLIFRGDSMPEVARHIERWYNVKVNIADKELNKYSFRATFQDDPVEEVIRCLSMTSPIKYKITPRLLAANGIYQKTQITIYKANRTN